MPSSRSIAILVLGGLLAGQARAEDFLSTYANYSMWVPWNWGVIQKSHEKVGEHVIVAPKFQRAVELNIISKISDRPLVTHEIDARMKLMFQGYQTNFADARVERGPSVVPMGNDHSLGYLVIYNTPTPDGEKMTVRETINFINRRWGPGQYLHVLITARCPLYLADAYSATLAKALRSLEFWDPSEQERREKASLVQPTPKDQSAIEEIKGNLPK